MRQDVYELLQQADWGGLGKKLEAYATWRATNYAWRNGTIDQLAQGMTPEDIARDVIDKTLRGQRQWDPDKGALEPWLNAQVRSEVDHLYNDDPSKYEQYPYDETDDDDDEQIDPLKATIIAAASSPSAETEVLQRERVALNKQRVGELFAVVEEEPGLLQIIEAVMKGCEWKPQALAAELGVPVLEINNRIKRLRRSAIQLGKETRNG